MLQNWGIFCEEMKIFEFVNFSKLFLGTTGMKRNYLDSFWLSFEDYVFSVPYFLSSSISQQLVEILKENENLWFLVIFIFAFMVGILAFRS